MGTGETAASMLELRLAGPAADYSAGDRRWEHDYDVRLI